MQIQKRNELKERCVRFGEILRRMNNNIQQPHGKYRELFRYTNKCFSAVKYVVLDVMAQTSDAATEGYVGEDGVVATLSEE